MTIAIVVFALVMAADQLSKSAVAARLLEGEATGALMFGVRVRHVANRQGPWGSRAGVGWIAVSLFLFAAVASGLTVVFGTPWMCAGLGALLGGAAGNLLDGLSRKAVTDFIDLRVWPVFNIADAAIVAGAAIMLLELIAA